ncbi:hypothetical protein [Luteimonas sp. R10]|uniref:hypothetical protein n=1 Tax=Luteimonas sp. R10 TaxID=3108176 RepID=UPI0030888D04|nr:hypothetical protein U3649_10520 [Luteimonas sp. R10]
MTDRPIDSTPLQASSPERGGDRWLHDVRNAANTARLAIHVAETRLRRGEHDRALANLARARDACDRLARMTAPEQPDPGNGKDPAALQAGDGAMDDLCGRP